MDAALTHQAVVADMLRRESTSSAEDDPNAEQYLGCGDTQYSEHNTHNSMQRYNIYSARARVDLIFCEKRAIYLCR